MGTLQQFTWSKALETGVPAIDIQHKELIRAFNDLATAIEQGNGTVSIRKLLSFLKYYAEWHFEREEQCADQCNCPFAETNKRAHKRFVEIFRRLHEEYRQSGGNEAVARQVHQELSEWIVSHVLRIDMEIGKNYQESEGSPAASLESVPAL